MSVTGNYVIGVIRGYTVKEGNTSAIPPLASSFTRIATVPYGGSVATPAGFSGVLTTRTSNTAGVVTATNTLVGTETIALFWIDPTTGNQFCAFGGTLSGVSGSGFTVSGLSGNNLPIATSAVTCAIAQSVTGLSIPGSSLLGLSVSTPMIGLAAFYDSGPTLRLSEVVTQQLPYSWPVNSTDTTPVAYTIARIDYYGGSLYASSVTVSAFA